MSIPMLYRDALRTAVPAALPTHALDRLERLAVEDALTASLVERMLIGASDQVYGPTSEETMEWLGAEALNQLHLSETEIALAVDADLHTSAAWLSGALFHAMDRARMAA
jgi:hypothetical protein